MGGARTAVADPAVRGPVVEGLDAAVYVVPTDAPEADGTLAWDKTTLVLVTARAGDQQGIGWSYAAAAAAPVVTGVLAGARGPEHAGCGRRQRGDDPRAAQHRPPRDRGHRHLRGRHRALGPEGPAARLLGRRPARPARDDVPVYGSGGFTTYDGNRDQPGGRA